MKDITFNINSRIDVICDDNAYKSIIQDIAETHLSIGIPVSNGKYFTPRVMESIEIVYYYEGNAYKFYGLVIGRRSENNIPQLLIRKPDKLIKIQRREYVRVNMTQYIKYIKLENNKISNTILETMQDGKGRKAILIDISGGGCKVKVYEDMKVGDVIIADIPYDEGNIRVKGKIIRVDIDEDKNKVCGVNFLDIENKLREKIIRYIFEIMRKQRKTL
jgi:c-di-GMP-binding flagellar brake protein YcgR